MTDRLSTAEKAALTSGSEFWRTTAAGDVPDIMLTDGPHGVRKQSTGGDHAGLLASEPSTCFPPAVALGATWDRALVRRVGEALGDEARAMGVSVLLGPGINLKRTPLGGRNFEYYAEDPLLTGVLATEWVHGLQSRGVGASVKHFAVNSQETDRMRVSADVDERTLRELYLRAFQRVVREARPWTVMCAYNKVNGVYASEHHWLLTEVLRGEWGFDGVVVSDWGAVADRVAAVRAGLDLTMPGPDPAGDRALVTAVEDGTLDAAALDTSAERVRALVRRATGAAATGTPAVVDPDAHHALAREVAAHGIVLLKNDGDLLPLPGSGTSIALIGVAPRFQGGGSSQINPTRVDDVVAEITASTSAPVLHLDGTDPDAAVAAARSADVAVVLAATANETEGRDRESLELPAEQIALITRVAAANPRTVVVLTNGAVVLTSPWDAAVPALVEGWLLGQAAGGALADVLFGRVNPSGRLTETIPLRLADHPSYLDFPGEGGHVRYGEGLFAGYRGFDARGLAVSYPFGHGLSYTRFEYGPAAVDTDGGDLVLRVPVTNVGARDGREVVQVYASRPDSAVRRAPRELKGFTVVTIPAGATVTAEIRIARADLAHWDVRLGRWVVEGGAWLLAAGASSRDVRAAVTAEVAGDDARVPLGADSTLAEWMADPRGALVLKEALAAAPAGIMSDPEILTFLGSLPLSRMAAFQGGPDAAELARLVAAANA